ncbi:MAG TPA: hypothetical protein VKI43_01620 [Vicinamibacterales bacterium]|nr:hypothetical protein [Vicinamibacterales bacterium]
MNEPGKAPSASQQLANELAETAVVEHKADRAQRVVVPSAVSRQRTVRLSLALAVPILVAVLLAEFAWEPLTSFFETAPSPAIASQQAHDMMDAVVAGIESFRKDYKTLPTTLVEIGVPPRGQWSYAAVGGQYTVRGTVYGQGVNFDSSTAPKPVPEKK